MPIVTLPGGELRDEIRQPLYDTIIVAAAEGLVGVRRFFQSNVIAGGAPKSLAATNMEQPGSLPTATSFRVQGLAVDADNAAIANNSFLPAFLRSSSVSLLIGVKNYWQSPLRYACGRLQAMLSSGADYQQYGWSAVQAVVFQGKHVVDINPLQNFQISWVTNAQDLTAAEAALTVAAATQLTFQASLKGLLRRPVQ
jgi:hypothetical protein